MIKAIVFDLDDTLISEKEYIQSGFKTVCKKISLEYNISYEILFDRILELFKESSKEVFNRLLESVQIKYTNDYILELIKVYREHTPEIKFFDDVIPTIKTLRERGYKLGIITDGYKETQLRKIEALKCRELFDEIIVTDELGREFWKPHEKSYKLMAEKLNVNLNEMVYIGDNENKDFITANKLKVISMKIIRNEGIYEKTFIGEEYLALYNLQNLYNVYQVLEKM